MKVVYWDIIRQQEKEKDIGIQYLEFEDVLRQADFVTIHVPYAPETHHLIGRDQLKLMKPNAHLINTSRGPVVDEAALTVALREKWIAGAGLDVFENEPIDPKTHCWSLTMQLSLIHISEPTRPY